MNARRCPLSRIFNVILLVVSIYTPMLTRANMKSVNQKIDRMREEKKAKNKIPVLTRAEKEQEQQKKQKSTKRLPKHKQRRNRRIEKTKQQSKTLSTMEYDDLKKKKNILLVQNDKETAVKYLEQMLKLCESINLIAENMLELADIYFDMGELQKAELLYTEFTHLYPGNINIEYAQYKAIVCSFYATLDAERDQSKTDDTIALSDNFLERCDVFKKYQGEVEKIRTQCYQKVVDSEVNVFSFYLKRGNIKSAQHRLNNLKTDWSDKLPVIKPRIIALEQELQNKKNELAGNKPPVKKEKTSTEKTTTLAQHKGKRSLAQRF